MTMGHCAVRSCACSIRLASRRVGYGSAGEFLLHPPPDRPGCLLLDVRLPGPSGFDLHEALKYHAITLPVVFLTGYADVASSVRALKAGAVDGSSGRAAGSGGPSRAHRTWRTPPRQRRRTSPGQACDSDADRTDARRFEADPWWRST